MKSMMKKVRVVLTAVSLLSLAACDWNWLFPPASHYPPGMRKLGVTFQRQQDSAWCSLACVSMWVKYKGTPYAAEQWDILDWMETVHWDQVGGEGSLSPTGIRTAISDFSQISTGEYWYVDDYRAAIADIQKGISYHGSPTIVLVNNDLHARLVVGASWSQLGNYQPSADYIVTMDPWDFGERMDTVLYWQQNVGAFQPGWIHTIATVGQDHWATDELSYFDSWGGTYYGEDNPPDGCDKCPPPQETSLLPRLLSPFRWGVATSLSRGNAALPIFGRKQGTFAEPLGKTRSKDRRRQIGVAREPTHGVRREIYVPAPWGRSRAELQKNVLAAFSQTKLRDLPGWYELGALLDANLVTISSATHVTSISTSPNYWLLAVRAGGQPYARVLMSEVGWLLSAMRVPPAEEGFEPRDTSWAASKIVEAGKAATHLRVVYMEGDLTRSLGSPDYHPLVEATLADGAMAYVAEDGSMYAPDYDGAHTGVLKDGGHRFARIR